MNLIIFNGKRSPEFLGEWGGKHVIVWQEEREGRDVLKLQSSN